jgi:Flp pilus assembly protein TadG
MTRSLAGPSWHRPRKRSGANVVEFAVVAPVFLMLIIGIIELGRGIMVNHQLGDAARLGCRAAVIEGKSTSAVTSTVTNYLTSMGLSGSTVTVKVNGSGADASSAQANDDVTVQVSLPVSGFTWVPGARYLAGSVAGEVTLRRE